MPRPRVDEDLEPPTCSWETVVVESLQKHVVRAMAKPLVLGALVLLGLGGLGATMYATVNMPEGFMAEDLMNPNMQIHWFFKHFSPNFGTMDHNLVFKDLDYPNQQKEIVELWNATLALDFMSPSPAPQWLTTFSKCVVVLSI